MRLILPSLMARITGKPRYIPNIEWSDKSWVHNIFRVYELVFGRRKGIRAESSSWFEIDDNGRQHSRVKLYTFEAICAHLEALVRNLFKIPWSSVRVESFQFALPQGFSQSAGLPIISFAVAHDANSNANSGAAPVVSLTWSHTTSGSDRLLAVGLSWTGSSTTITRIGDGITYAGTTAGAETVETLATSSYRSNIFWWVAPATGANNVVATPTSVASIYGGGTSFTGVDQTTPVPAADRTNIPSQSGFGNRTITLSTTIDNEMLFAHLGLANFTSTLSTVSPATEAYNQGNTTAARRATGSWWLTSAAGSNSIVQNISGSTNRSHGQTMIGINEVGGAVATITPRHGFINHQNPGIV